MFGLYTIDGIIVLLLILGSFIGLKKGIVKSVVSFAGLIIAFVLAWFLKNPISEFMYTKFPFFSFTGETALINIIIYELIAFLIIAIVLLVIVKLVTHFTGLVSKILTLSKSMGFISKLLGMIFGFIETYVIIFMVLFFMYNFTNIYKTIEANTLATRMLDSTPLLTNMVESERSSFEEIANLSKNYKENSEEYNEQLFDILLKYDVIKPSTAKKLVEENKVKINNADKIIEKYNS